MLLKIKKVNNIKLKYCIGERRPGDVAACYADPSKAEKELNWKAEKKIEEMCKDSWNFEKNRKKCPWEKSKKK